MIAWAVVAMAQALLLPGLIAALLVRDLEWPDRLMLAPPLSLVLNYFLVLLLVLAHGYTRPALVACVAIELALLVLSMKRLRDKHPADAAPATKAARPLSWADAAIGALAVASLVPYAYIAYEEFGTIFTLWDAVVSWNRWATVWYQGVLPPATFTYPQAVPTVYSLVYEFVGDPDLQSLPKTVAMVYPFVAFATVARIGWIHPSSRRVALLSIPVFAWFGAQQFPGLPLVFSGYVDAVIAYFGILAVYLFALLHRRHMADRAGFWDDRLLYLALLIVAGAALVKQTGGFLAILFPLALYWYLGRNGVAFWRMRKLWACGLLYAFIVAHWYVFKLVQFHLGLDTASAAGYFALIPGPMLMRPMHGLLSFFDAVGWWFAPAFVLGLLDPIARCIALWLVLPLFLIWAFTVSYDLRGLFIAMPWIAIVCAAGFALAIRWAAVSPIAAFAAMVWFAGLAWDITGKAPATMHKAGPAIPVAFYYGLAMVLIMAAVAWRALAGWGSARRARIALACAAVAFGGVFVAHYSSPKYSTQLHDSSVAEQRKLGDAALNAYLLDYFARHPSAPGDVATSYQFMAFIPGLESHYRLAPCAWDPEFFHDPSVRYFLTSYACTSAVNQSIAQQLRNARKLASIHGYDFYKLDAAGEAPEPAQAKAASPPVDAPASSRAADSGPIVANDYTDSLWTNGVGAKEGLRNRFFFLADSAAQDAVHVGTRLYFRGSGTAEVKEVAPVAQGGRYAIFVRVDRELDPAADGFPNPITIERPAIVIDVVRRHKWLALALALALILLEVLARGLLPRRRRMSQRPGY